MIEITATSCISGGILVFLAFGLVLTICRSIFLFCRNKLWDAENKSDFTVELVLVILVSVFILTIVFSLLFVTGWLFTLALNTMR